MPTLKTTASNFTGSYAGVNTAIPRHLNVSKRRLMKFAKSVGLPILRTATPTPQHAIALATYKAQAVKCAVDFTTPRLARPTRYTNMDMSEKINISFWTGMVFAALLADQYLGISRLMHAASLKRSRLLTTTPGSGRSLADFVGQDQLGNWHVIEAKARQSAPSTREIAKWKRQTGTIGHIYGMPPATRSYALTNVGAEYSVELVDPEELSPQRYDINFPSLTGTILQGYYGSLLEWLSDDGTVISVERDDTPCTTRLAGYDPIDREYIFWGLTADTLSALRRNEIPPIIESRELDDTYIGSDGMVISTASSPELSQQNFVQTPQQETVLPNLTNE